MRKCGYVLIIPLFLLIFTTGSQQVFAMADMPQRPVEVKDPEKAPEVPVAEQKPETPVENPPATTPDTTAFMMPSPISPAGPVESPAKKGPTVTDIKDDSGNLIRREYRDEKGEFTKKEHFTNNVLSLVEEFHMNKVLRSSVYGRDGKVEEQTFFMTSGPAEGKPIFIVRIDGETVLSYDHYKYDGEGVLTAKNTYDGSNKLLGAQSFDSETGLTATDIYDNQGVLIRREYRDQDGKLKKNELFVNGSLNLIEEFTYGEMDKLSGKTIRFPDGKLRQEIWFFTSGPAEGKAGRANNYENGILVTSEAFEYNDAAILIKKTIFDAQGRYKAVHVFDPNAKLVIEAYTYDMARNRIDTVEYFNRSEPQRRLAIGKYFYRSNGILERIEITNLTYNKIEEIKFYDANGKIHHIDHYDIKIISGRDFTTLQKTTYYYMNGRHEGTVYRVEWYTYQTDPKNVREQIRLVYMVDTYEYGFPILTVTYHYYGADLTDKRLASKTTYFMGTDKKKHYESYNTKNQPIFGITNGKIDYFARAWNDPTFLAQLVGYRDVLEKRGEIIESIEYDPDSGKIYIWSWYTKGSVNYRLTYYRDSDPDKSTHTSIRTRFDARLPSSYLNSWLGYGNW